MATLELTKCDGCGTTVENRYAAKGWISIEGNVTRAHGRYNGSCFATDFLPQRRHDFCSPKCFVAALNKERDARKKRREPR